MHRFPWSGHRSEKCPTKSGSRIKIVGFETTNVSLINQINGHEVIKAYQSNNSSWSVTEVNQHRVDSLQLIIAGGWNPWLRLLWFGFITSSKWLPRLNGYPWLHWLLSYLPITSHWMATESLDASQGTRCCFSDSMLSHFRTSEVSAARSAVFQKFGGYFFWGYGLNMMKLNRLKGIGKWKRVSSLNKLNNDELNHEQRSIMVTN